MRFPARRTFALASAVLIGATFVGVAALAQCALFALSDHDVSAAQTAIARAQQIVRGGSFDDYLPMVRSRWEGTECTNFSPPIYAYRAENIAIVGGRPIA